MIAPVFCPDPEAANTAQTQIRNKYTAILKQYRVAPSTIAALRLQFQERSRLARVHAATPVGPLNVEALTTHFVQAAITLAKGGKGDGNAVNGLREIFSAQLNPSNPKMDVHFVDKYIKYDAVLAFGRELIETNVSDLVKDIIVEYTANLVTGPWSDAYMRINNVVLPIVVDPSLGHLVMRVYLNVDQMYLRDVKVHQLVSIISGGDGGVICVASPLSIGIIDIYADPRQVQSVVLKHFKESIQMAEFAPQVSINAFFDIVSKSFSTMLVKGIVGIKQAIPQKYFVYQSTTSSERKWWRLTSSLLSLSMWYRYWRIQSSFLLVYLSGRVKCPLLIRDGSSVSTSAECVSLVSHC